MTLYKCDRCGGTLLQEGGAHTCINCGRTYGDIGIRTGSAPIRLEYKFSIVRGKHTKGGPAPT